MGEIPSSHAAAWVRERRGLLVMALVAMAVLLYEIAITRLLSVVLWYHFAFLSISVAMLGLGASAVWLSVRERRVGTLERAMLVAGLAIPLSVVVIVRLRPTVSALGLGEVGWLSALVLALGVPMFALGTAICALLLEAQGRAAGRMYAADLIGATAGAALVVPLLSWIPTPQLLALVGLLPLAALALHRPASRAWIVGSALVIGIALWGAPLQVGYSKLHGERGDYEPTHEVWTATARIAVFDRPIFSPTPDIPWGWGYGSRYRPAPAREMWIDQDGSAGTPIEHLPGEPAALSHLLFDVTSLGYQLRAPRKVCIIGAGGGRDIVTALATGAREVDAVEINPAIVALMRGPLAEFSGGIYSRPEVRPIVDEGRSFLSRTDARYDLLQVSLVDSWAATTAGAFALSENYLYTVEALRLYLQRLSPDGVLSISRYTDRVQPFEGARLILLAQEALRQHGVEQPRRHLVFVSGSHVGTLLVGARPFDAAALESLDRIAQVRGFVRHFPVDPQRPVRSFVSLAMHAGTDVFARSGLDLSPPVDDRPFFFQAAKLFRPGAEEDASELGDMNVQSVAMLRKLLLSLGAITLVFFVAPFVLRRPGLPRRAGSFAGSAYFVLIGVAFMLVEIPWVQKSILLLGHPSHATSVTLAALLLSAGVGSALSARVSDRTRGLLIAALPIVVAFCSLLIGPLFRAGLSAPMIWRVLLAVAVFAAPGLLMGAALPAGFLRFGDAHKAWFWAMNGFASVLSSVLAVALSMALGFSNTTLIGAGLYALAALLFRASRRSADVSRSAEPSAAAAHRLAR